MDNSGSDTVSIYAPLQAANSTNTIGNLFTTGGNVGINNKTPGYTLDVSGSARFASNNNGSPNAFLVGNSNPGSSAYSILQLYNDTSNQLNLFYNSSQRVTNGQKSGATLRNDGGSLILASNASYIYLGTSGNIGINNQSPQVPLDINGVINVYDGTKNNSAGLATEVNTQIIDMGINSNRFGNQYNANQGGFFRVDTRAGSSVLNGIVRAANSTTETLAFAVNGSGNVDFPVSISCNGVDFTYSSGNWTPTITGQYSVPSGISYSTQTGKYVKIGKFVQLYFDVSFSWSSAAAGNPIFMNNVPFTSYNLCSGTTVPFTTNIPGAANLISCYILAYTLEFYTGNNICQFTIAGNSARITGSISYIAS